MDWQSLNAFALQTVAQHLHPSAVAAARLTCQAWRQAMNPQHILVSLSQMKPPTPNTLATFARATAATVYINSCSFKEQASTSCQGCCCCQQVGIVAQVLQQLPNLQKLTFRQWARAQQMVQKPQQLTACSECSRGFNAAEQIVDDPKQLFKQLVHPRNQLVNQLQQLSSLDLHVEPLRGVDHLICVSLPQLSRLEQLTLRIDLDNASDVIDMALQQPPHQLQSLQLLPADNFRSNPGSWQYRPTQHLSADALQGLANCKQLHHLKIGLPLRFNGGHAVALQQLLAAGQITALLLPVVSWNEPLDYQQQLGQDIAAALLASVSAGSSSNSSLDCDAPDLRSLHLGADISITSFKFVLPAFQQLTHITDLQLPVQFCRTDSVAALSSLKDLQYMTWSGAQYSGVIEHSNQLQLMSQFWPKLAGFNFQGQFDMRRARSSSSSRGWKLLQQWSQLQCLNLGPLRLAQRSEAPVMSVEQLPIHLTSLGLTNMFFCSLNDSSSWQLPCCNTLKKLTICVPWRVKKVLSLYAVPCLAGCTQLTSLELVGARLQSDTLSKVLWQHCTQLSQLLLSYVSFDGGKKYGIADAFDSSSGGMIPAAAAPALNRLQLTSLHLDCDTSHQLMELMSVLEDAVVAPACYWPAGNASPVVGNRGCAGGSVRVLHLSCKQISPQEARQVIAKLASCCGGLTRLSVHLYGHSDDVYEPLKALTDVCVQTAL